MTREGVLRTRAGDLRIIPGSVAAEGYIVRGESNPDSFHYCSHGPGRVMSRREARKRYTVDDHVDATDVVERRKDIAVINKTPLAYKTHRRRN